MGQVARCLRRKASASMTVGGAHIPSLAVAILLAKNVRIVPNLDRYAVFIKDARTGEAEKVVVHTTWRIQDGARLALSRKTPETVRRIVVECSKAQEWWPTFFAQMLSEAEESKLSTWINIPTYIDTDDGGEAEGVEAPILASKLGHIKCMLMDEIVYSFFRERLGFEVHEIPRQAAYLRRCDTPPPSTPFRHTAMCQASLSITRERWPRASPRVASCARPPRRLAAP